jgi:hypothetical protein
MKSGAREAHAMAKQIDQGEFDFSIVSKGNQIGEERTLGGRHTGYSSIKEIIEFLRGRGVQIRGTV